MVSQSCLNAARFIIHLHTTPRIYFLSSTTVQMPVPISQGQIAISGERLSVANSPREIAVPHLMDPIGSIGLGEKRINKTLFL